MDNRPIYGGALWHSDCEPFARVAAYSYAEVEKYLRVAAEEEYKYMSDTFECLEHETQCDCEPEDDILSSGVHEFDAQGLSEREKAELDEHGYVWLDS